MSFIACTFNLQHGEGTDAVTNYQRQLDAMNGADLVAVQERSSPDSGWDTPMTNAGLAQALYRPNQIGGGDGNAIWYKSANVTVLNAYECQLSIGATSPWDGIPTNVDKCAVAAKVQVEGKKFYFVNTHLCQNAGADADQSLFSAIRVNQIKALMSWINSELVGLDVLLLGDMNLGPNYLKTPDGFQHDLFTSQGFDDLWRRGIINGTATANWGDRNSDSTPDMVVDDNTVTHDTRRIDYGLLRRVHGALSLSAVDVPDLRVNCSGALTGSPQFCPDTNAAQRWGNSGDYGVRPTDHNPVKFTMTVNANAPNAIVKRTPFSWFPNVRL